MKDKTVYVVEDDPSIQKLLEYTLESRDYKVVTFENAENLFDQLNTEIPDLFILDIMLPDMDGTQILETLRNKVTTKDVPIIMLTAKTSEIDVITNLDLGADDYIKKPFSTLELLSRVNAIFRRMPKEEMVRDYTYDVISIDDLKREVLINDEKSDLSYKEYELLLFLVKNSEIVLSRDIILEKVWGYDYSGETRTVDMHIRLLREKLGDKKDLIKTVRGVGYKLSSGE